MEHNQNSFTYKEDYDRLKLRLRCEDFAVLWCSLCCRASVPVWSGKPAVKLCVYSSSLKHLHRLQQHRHTFLGHGYALIPLLSMCVLYKCLQLFLQLKILFSCEMNVYFLKPSDSSSYSRLTPYAAPFFCHFSISRTDVVGVKLLKFKECITH